MIQDYFLSFYIKSKIFFTNISQSIYYYSHKVKDKLNFDYSNLDIKEPYDDLTKLTIYEEKSKKENKTIYILEEHDIENNHINQLS